MPFSGNRQTKTPGPAEVKFCKIDHVGEHTKKGWNRFTRRGSTLGDLYKVLPLFFMYLAFFFFYGPTTKPLHHFARMMAQSMQFGLRKYL
jgi:hypothetical protein